MAANNVDPQPTKSSSAIKKQGRIGIGAEFHSIDGGVKTRSRILMDADLLFPYPNKPIV